MYSDFRFLWLQTKFLHMITSAQTCKPFQEGFHVEIFGFFQEKAGWVHAPPGYKGFFIWDLKTAVFHSTLQFSLAGIYQIFSLLSLVPLKIKLTTVKQILTQTAL